MAELNQNLSLANRLIEVINKKDLKSLDDIFAPNAVDHALPQEMPPTRDASLRLIRSWTEAFPDLRYKVDFTVSEGDRIAQRLTCSGTMRGSFMGYPSTGKSATWTETDIYRFSNGKLVEHWSNIDRLGMMQQLGLM